MSPVTDPFAPDTPDLLTRSMSTLAAATVVLPSGERIALDLEDGSTIEWDETRAPRVEANLVCRIPTARGTLQRIDPRTGARVEVQAGYSRPGGVQDLQTIADLVLRDSPRSRPDDTMVLTARSDESLVIDMGPVNSQVISGASTTATIVAVLQQCFAGLAPTITGPTGPAVASERFDDRWDFVADLADRIGSRVYDDGLRNWFIGPVPVVSATVAHTLATGATGTVTDYTESLSRDGGSAPSQEWGNAVFLVHEWVDSTNVPRRIAAYRRVQTGPYASVAGNIKIVTVRRQSSISQANANAAADALVARAVTRGRYYNVTGIAALWVRPGNTLRLALPASDPEDHLVVRVKFDLARGLMDATTRLPDNAGTIGA